MDSQRVMKSLGAEALALNWTVGPLEAAQTLGTSMQKADSRTGPSVSAAPARAVFVVVRVVTHHRGRRRAAQRPRRTS